MHFVLRALTHRNCIGRHREASGKKLNNLLLLRGSFSVSLPWSLRCDLRDHRYDNKALTHVLLRISNALFHFAHTGQQHQAGRSALVQLSLFGSFFIIYLPLHFFGSSFANNQRSSQAKPKIQQLRTNNNFSVDIERKIIGGFNFYFICFLL